MYAPLLLMLSLVLVDSFLDLSACCLRCEGAKHDRILRLEECIHEFLRQRLVSWEVELHLSLEPISHCGSNRMAFGRQNPNDSAWRTRISSNGLRL